MYVVTCRDIENGCWFTVHSLTMSFFSEFTARGYADQKWSAGYSVEVSDMNGHKVYSRD